MKIDWIFLGFVAVILVLGVIHRGIWFDRFMGALLVFFGVYVFLIGFGALPRLHPKPTVIPYPVIGATMIVQGVALGVFHARF